VKGGENMADEKRKAIAEAVKNLKKLDSIGLKVIKITAEALRARQMMDEPEGKEGEESQQTA